MPLSLPQVLVAVVVADAAAVAAGACCRNSGRRCRNARMFLVVDLDREMPYRLPVSSWEGHLHWHFRHRPKAQAATSTAASVDHSPPMRGPCDAAPPAGASDLRSYGQLRGRDRRRHRLPQAQVPRCRKRKFRVAQAPRHWTAYEFLEVRLLGGYKFFLG